MYAGFVQQTKTVNSDRRSPAILCWSSSYGPEGRNTMVRVAASRSHSTNLETYLIWLSFVPYTIYQAHYVLPPHLCYLQTEAETLRIDITVQFLCFTGLVRWEWRLRTGKFSSFIQYVFVWLFSSYSCHIIETRVYIVVSSVNCVWTLALSDLGKPEHCPGINSGQLCWLLCMKTWL